MRPWQYIDPDNDPLVIEVMHAERINNRELAKRIGLSESVVSRRVDDLEAQGQLIKLRAGKSVAIKATGNRVTNW